MTQNNGKPQKPDTIALIGYLLAAALILPLAFWLKANYARDFGAWLLGLVGY